MYLIIGFWGGERRIYSAYKFFLYTLLGSVLMLLAIIFLYQEFGTTSIPRLFDFSLPFYIQVETKIERIFKLKNDAPQRKIAPRATSIIFAGS